jgi:hypothetical protein
MPLLGVDLPVGVAGAVIAFCLTVGLGGTISKYAASSEFESSSLGTALIVAKWLNWESNVEARDFAKSETNGVLPAVDADSWRRVALIDEGSGGVT